MRMPERRPGFDRRIHDVQRCSREARAAGAFGDPIAREARGGALSKRAHAAPSSPGSIVHLCSPMIAGKGGFLGAQRKAPLLRPPDDRPFRRGASP